MTLTTTENKVVDDVVIERDIDDIIERLLDLQAYSRVLSQRTEVESEENLPEYPVPHFVQKIRMGLKLIIKLQGEDKAIACSDFEETLRASYIFYLSRLAADAENNAWAFKFPRAFECTHAAVYTHQ